MIKQVKIHKHVKTGLKILGLLFVFIVVLLTAASVYIHFNKNQILQKITAQLGDAIKGEVIIKDMDVSLLSSFPYAGINLEKVSILDSQYKSELLKARIVSCRLSFFQLLAKQPEIAKLVLSDGSFHLFTDSNGYSNSYVLSKKNTAKSGNSSGINIHRIELTNINVLIEDAIKNKRYSVICLEWDASIDKKDSLLLVKLDEKSFVNGLGFNIKKGNYLAGQTVEAKNWHIKINTLTQDISFERTNIKINRHPFDLQGRFHLKDSAWFHLHAVTKDVSYRLAAAILTDTIQKKLNLAGLASPFDVEADISGVMAPKSQPHVFAKWTAKNNEFNTPVILFNNCSFSGIYNNQTNRSVPPSDENSHIVLTNFKSKWGNIELSTDSIQLKNLAQPILKFNFRTAVSFETLDEQLGLETVRFTGGTAQVALRYNGTISTGPALLSGITSDIQLKNATVIYQPRNITFTNVSGKLSISQNDIAVEKLECNVEQNHFVVNIAGSDVNRLAQNNSGKSYIACNVFTPSLNLNDFRSVFTKKVRSSSSKHKAQSKLSATTAKIDDMLEKGDLQLNVKANHISLNNFDADNVQAQLLFQQEDWEIQNASLQHAGGKLTMSGKIHEVNDTYHNARAKFTLENVDVKKVFYAFDNFGQDGITHNNLRGKLAADADISIALNNSGHIIKNSMQGIVYFSLKKGALVDYLPLKPLNDFAILNRDFTNMTFAELKDSLIVKDNQVQIKRMEIASSAVTMYVEGVYGINRNTDISIQIPLNNLKLRDSSFVPKNKGVNAKTGKSLFLKAKTDSEGKVKIKLESIFKKHGKNKSD